MLTIAIGFVFAEPGNPCSKEQLAVISDQIESTKNLKHYEKELLMANFNIFQKNNVNAMYVCKLFSTVFHFDVEHIRKTIKLYLKNDTTILKHRLLLITIFYTYMKIDHRENPNEYLLSKLQQKEFDAMV